MSGSAAHRRRTRPRRERHTADPSPPGPAGRAEQSAPPEQVTASEPTGSGEPGPASTVPVDSLAPEADPDAPIPLLEPAEGTPEPVADGTRLAELVAAVAAGTGPVAVDAERASGYRYGQRAYLVQLRRAGAGTWLIDPVGCPDLFSLQQVIGDVEWVLHAANQDLPCLAELGLAPSTLFDTELAGRLAGFERVGLGPMVETVLHRSLEKGHSAADWSTRPLPAEWLTYAALDVELLVELRGTLAEELTRQGKLSWALEEFAAIVAAPPPPPRVDPWRRTSGIHRIRNARGLAMVRSLWETRDEMARRRDIAPGRVLPDAAIINAVRTDPQSPEELVKLPVYGGRATRRHAATWYAALEAGRHSRDVPRPVRGDGPPPVNRWAERDPVAAGRLVRCRTALAAIGEEHTVPVENLLLPDSVRRLAWRPPEPVDAVTVADFLRTAGARPWQVALTADALAAALPTPEPAAD